MGPLTIANDGSLRITTEPVIVNVSGGQLVNISGGLSSRVFFVTPGANVTLDRLWISGGRFSSPNDGAAIDNFDGTVTIDKCLIFNNVSTDDAGAVKNTAGGTITINDTEFQGNAAPSRGGAIFNEGDMTITNSLFRSNTAKNGGAIANTGMLTIKNSTISGNDSAFNGGGNGGGIYTAAGTVNLDSVTVAFNFAGGGSQGGGVGKLNGNETFISTGSIFSNNSAVGGSPNFMGDFTSHGYNLIANPSGTTIGGPTGFNLLNVDPKLLPLKNNGGPTATHALARNSPAIDKGNAKPETSTDQRGLPRVFNYLGISNPRPTPNGGSDIGAFEFNPRDLGYFDFDGDQKTDLSIFRPSVGEWWYLKSSDAGNGAFQFGSSSDKIVPGDYTGDGKADIAFFRPSSGEWYILRSEDFSFYSFPFGTSNDIPVPADYDGDLKVDAAVFRPSTAEWFVNRSTGGATLSTFGAAGDRPVPADYDGDGNADLAIFRPSNGTWWMNRSQLGVVVATFGVSTDKTVQGDYTGDGKADVAFFRPSTQEWFVLRSEDSSFYSFPYGATGDIPAPGDYDGDGKYDSAVFRPSNNTWFLLRSTAGSVGIGFGATNDVPVPNAFVR
ncbi:MAG: VCBS repeat-containing protein [Pyrinomonadaceae bacterium]|nr:VCBS repeat-containing protein [Pyrinomonadaceae bacterium]